MTNPQNGSRFNREFTPDDLAIVNLGYWARTPTTIRSQPIRHRSNPRPNRLSPILKLPGNRESLKLRGTPRARKRRRNLHTVQRRAR